MVFVINNGQYFSNAENIHTLFLGSSHFGAATFTTPHIISLIISYIMSFIQYNVKAGENTTSFSSSSLLFSSLIDNR
jgi:hypothetical protein